jgi:nucleoside-diphosphate-sugar epimerase
VANSRIIVTGATGFVGRHLLEAFEREVQVFALSRRSPSSHGVTLPANARWFPVDIARPQDVAECTAAIVRHGGADTLIHLAGHYDFTGERNPEYQRTNVNGMRNVLEAAHEIGVRDFVFASSVAACSFPPVGDVLTESSPPAGDTPYAESKRAGERMLADYHGKFRTWIVRFAALFSDWCEYEPLFRFLDTWLSGRPRSNLLAGRGLSAVPYLHARDAVSCLRGLLEHRDELGEDNVLLASPNGCTTHLGLFEAATWAHFGRRTRPVLVPAPICRAGLRLRDAIGRTVGLQAFERPWMGRMIDLQLAVDASRTRRLLNWAPRARLEIARRMPFLIQNRKELPAEWQRLNHAALKSVRRHDNLRIHRVLKGRIGELAETLTRYVLDPCRGTRFEHLRSLGEEPVRADYTLLLVALAVAVRTGERALFRNRCRDLAQHRRSEGVPLEDMTAALDVLSDQCVLSLSGHEAGTVWTLALYDHVTMTVQFGIDEIMDVFEGDR